MMARRSATSIASSWSWVTSTVVTAIVVVQVAEPGAELLADLGVEGAEGLVEEEDPGLDGEGAGERHPLPLAPGELCRVAVGEVADADQLQQLVGPPPDLGLGPPPDLQPEGDVPPDGQVPERRVVLEAEADAPPAYRDRGHVLPVDLHRPGVRDLEPGHDAQERGLPAAARAEQGGEGARGHREGHVVESDGVAEPLADGSDGDRHLLLLLSGSVPRAARTPRARSARITEPA